MKMRFLSFAGLMLAAMAGQVQAGFVTFDGTLSAGTSTFNSSSTNFAQNGFNIEAFGGVNMGSGLATKYNAHTHISTDLGNSGRAELQHWNGNTQLQGILISKVGGGAFSLNSLDYRVRSTNSIDGFSTSDVNVLLSTSFDIFQTVASQMTSFSVGTVSSSYSNLAVTGFGNVTKVFISSSASVSFDNIEFGAPVGSSPVPEPASIAMWSIMGGIGLVVRRRRKMA